MKLFLFVILITVGALSNVLAESEDAQQHVCKPGVPYEENECNRCSCTPDYKLVCSRRLCPWNNNKGLQDCSVGRKWAKDCDNTCSCLENIGTLCTAHKC